MSDNEIEDVSFLPGESLHRRAIYEPNIIQKLRNVACNKGRAAVIATIGCLFLLVIALIAALSTGRSCKTIISEDSEKPEIPSEPKNDYISTNGKPFPYKDIRLPKSVIPTHYQLLLHPNISQSFFSGTVKIHCDITHRTNFIVFHVKTLNITKLELQDLKKLGQIEILNWLEYKTNEQVFVKLGTRLEAGSKVILEVDFQGDLVKKLAGFYKSMYKTNKGEERYIATTHFEPTDARAAFPCFDEPQLKATFKLSMIRDANHISLFNMPLKNTQEYGSGLKMDIFDETVKMSTYLVAFVVCDYQNITKSTKRDVMVRVFAPKDSIHAAHFALETAVKVIDHYEDFFGVPYPLPKQDLIAIPDFAAGAMENWGLITYRETAVLYDPTVSSARNMERVAVVVAHELAHQWFGNLVTMAWWDDLWLNEGFASFVEYIGSGVGHEDWKMDEQFVTETLLNALFLDGLENSHPINLQVDNPNQINELFDTITYDKGASIIRMLNKFLGDEVFKKGLKSYLNQYKYSNAATNDLWNSLSEAVTNSKADINTDVKSLMRTWTEQMGFPVITLERQKGGHKVSIRQERFLLYKQPNISTQSTSPFGYMWEVPFTYSLASKPNEVKKYLLKDASGSFEVPADITWIKGNYHMYGYYRVNYDEDGWRALIGQLNVNHSVFTATERAGMIDDAFMLARAGLLNYSIALDLSLYMVNEEDYIPWQTLIDNWKFIEHRIEDKPVYSRFKNVQLKLMKKQIEKMTWEDEGSMLDKYLRTAILNLAVSLEHEKSVNKGKELFQQWKTNHRSIQVNLKSVIYRTGIMYGKEEDWDTVWNAFLTENDASEKMKLLTALGQSKDYRLLSRLNNFSLNETLVRRQDAFRVLTSVSGTYVGQLLAWRFFRQNWEVYVDRYASTSFIFSTLIKGTCSNFATQFDYDEVHTFFKTRDAGTGKRAVSQVLEKIQSNIDWTQRYEKTVTDWINKRGEKPV
ncbi:endoplasmic reticulum aminopeptidase 1-like [Mercenaria mercenaria]|uniref:endoplasmic reticulum aminopeptidase 1-like n=1 Tax=Mercenaria mercenaria TaxID=6596 RepID=UPI00234F9C0F|nr:endoplasmic reticulum aminopeptidase 1-like [Mercenaria mercenaria]